MNHVYIHTHVLFLERSRRHAKVREHRRVNQ